MFEMRLDGKTYQGIATEANISRQRVQQILSPPKEIREYILVKYKGRCARCGIYVGKSGHIHHENTQDENYNDINNLELLCISCHRSAHKMYSNGETIVIQIDEAYKLLLVAKSKKNKMSLTTYCRMILIKSMQSSPEVKE